MRRHAIKVLLGVGVGLALVGCAPLKPITAQGPLTVTAMLADAHVSDARSRFAAVFEAELPSVPQAAAKHLHLDAPAAAQTDVEALKTRLHQRAPGTLVLVVPGLLGDCVAEQAVPFGDGQERPLAEVNAAYRVYDDLRLKGIRFVPLPGRDRVASNAPKVADFIVASAAEAGVERIVLLTYSKGQADAHAALALLKSQGRLPAQVTDVVSVAGLIMGTPLADRWAAWADAWMPHGAWGTCAPADDQVLADMRRSERRAALLAQPWPAGVQRYSVAAWATDATLSPLLRPLHGMLSDVDERNDGQMLVSDAIQPGGTLLAVVQADHWGVALPLDRHPSALVRHLASASEPFPRAALLRAVLTWVLGQP